MPKRKQRLLGDICTWARSYEAASVPVSPRPSELPLCLKLGLAGTADVPKTGMHPSSHVLENRAPGIKGAEPAREGAGRAKLPMVVAARENRSAFELLSIPKPLDFLSFG